MERPERPDTPSLLSGSLLSGGQLSRHPIMSGSFCNAAPSGRRLKLWEITPSMMCSVIGTCLTHTELVQVGKKAGIEPRTGATDYDVHAYFVREAAQPERLSRLLHKSLDRKYRAAISLFARHRDDESLAEQWALSISRGEIGSGYWALLTHPNTSPSLARQAFGEVHMLTHLEGAANRNASRRVQELETRCQDLSEQVARARRQIAEDTRQRHRLTAELDRERAERKRAVQAAQADEEVLATVQARVRALEDGEAFIDLHARNEALSADVARTRAALESERRRARLLEQELARAHQARTRALGRLQAAANECSVLRAMIENSDHPAGPDSHETDLSGRRIVCVGGHGGVLDRFRMYIESRNGRFGHHDGGIEDNMNRLEQILNQADVVLCPVPCVSHTACLRAKRFCKRYDRIFVPLRTASLSALTNGLMGAVAEMQTDGDQPAHQA